MPINKHIVVAGIIIMGTGVIRYWTGQTSSKVNLTRVLLGGYVLILILSLLDLSDSLKPLASAFADLAALAILFSSGIIGWIANLFPKQSAAGKTVARGTSGRASA